MVVGIISLTFGWLCAGPVPAILSVILGAIALSQIKKNPERFTGAPFAWTGIATGGLTLVIWGVLMIFYIIAAVASGTAP